MKLSSPLHGAHPLLRLACCACALAAAALPAAETSVEAVRMEFASLGTEAQFIFDERVRVEGTNLTVTCDRMEISSLREAASDAPIGRFGRIRRIVATGNVTITQEGRRATAGRAELLPLEGKVILTESPAVYDPAGVITGHRITILQGERKVLVESVKAKLQSMPDLGFPKDRPPPSAPAPGQP